MTQVLSASEHCPILLQWQAHPGTSSTGPKHMTEILAQPALKDLAPRRGSVLLLNAPAVDLRLPWARWHQPTGLLQIGVALQQQGNDVRFFDFLQPGQGSRIRRRKAGTVRVEGYDLNLWRFGLPWTQLANALNSLKEESWAPDCIFVSCLTISWWRAAEELIRYLKEGLDGRPPLLPGVPVILGGVYPTVEPQHAADHTLADVIVVGSLPEARTEIPQLELYGTQEMPGFAGVYLYQSQNVSDAETDDDVVPRPPEEVANEIAHKAKLDVTEFAFFDEEIRPDQREHFLEVLGAIARRELDIRLVALGNISPRLIDSQVARRMGQAGYRQVYLKCNVSLAADSVTYQTPYEVYERCAAALHREAGFRPRTDQLTAMLTIGFPWEDIEAVTERLIRLVSVVGSVNLVPYQYTPTTDTGRFHRDLIGRDSGRCDPASLNCKLYPLARLSGIPYEHYVELTRLTALLNSKFRSITFDFLGEGMVARAVRSSLRHRSWDPFATAEQMATETPVVPDALPSCAPTFAAAGEDVHL